MRVRDTLDRVVESNMQVEEVRDCHTQGHA